MKLIDAWLKLNIIFGKIQYFSELVFNDPWKIIGLQKRLGNRFAYKFWELCYRLCWLPYKIAYKVFLLMPDYIKISIRTSGPRWLRGVSNRRSSARRYLKKGVSLDSFFEILKLRDCNYVILRWWEGLPVVATGEDIDILIADEDRDKINDLLTVDREGQPLDLYTITGSRGGAFHDTTYFSSMLSNSILKTRILYKNKYYVPDDAHYFFSMAYHAIFHKGQNSLLPGFQQGAELTPEHDYTATLENLSHKMGGGININVSSLINILDERDFLPTPDALTLLAGVQPSLKELRAPLFCNAIESELSIFVLRHECIEQGYLDNIKKIIVSRFKFDILYETKLSKDQAHYLQVNMRGANWERGPYRKSGGGPAHVIVALDYYPEPLSERLNSEYPRFTNKHLLLCKRELRKELNYDCGFFHAYNPVHTADNEMESLWFLRRIMEKTDYSRLLNNLEMIRNNWKTKFPILDVASKGRRAKVELVWFNNRPAIKKTFKMWAVRYLERESFAADQLRENIGYIPRLLDRGEYYIITEYHSKKVHSDNACEFKALALTHKEDLKKFLVALWRAGYAHLNLTPSNIILSHDGLYVIDFEFLYKYPSSKPVFLESYDVTGVPIDFDDDLPAGYCRKRNSFVGQWRWVFGSVGNFFAE